MKKFTLLLAFVISLLLSLGCCASLTTINAPPINLIPHLKNSTAALVYKTDNGAYVPYCGAVWVTKTHLLTAKHCVEDDNDKTEIGSVHKFQTYEDFEYNYPFSKNKKIYFAKLITEGSESEDIAILLAMDDVKHGIATIASYTPQTGQVLHIIGHPQSLGWSYIQGQVSQEARIVALGSQKTKRHVIHITGLMWYGNSGGGAFDSDGNLVAISSMLVPTYYGPMGAFMFIHPEVMRLVLDKGKIKYHSLN